MRRVSVMVVLFVASIVLGETMHAGTGMNRLASRGKTFVNKLADVGGVRHVRNFFATPEGGGYSPALKTFVAGAFALATCWGAVSISGCAARVGPVDVIMTPWGGVIIPNLAEEAPTLGITADLYDVDVNQETLSGGLILQIVNIDGKNYAGVLIRYREGSNIRTGLVYSPSHEDAYLAFRAEDKQFIFVANKSFQAPEYLPVKHLNSEIPDALITAEQVLNVLIKDE